MVHHKLHSLEDTPQKPKAWKIHCHGLMEILNLQHRMSLIQGFVISLTKLEMDTEGKLHRDTAA